MIVLVSGAPGSGKSTLAARLAGDLRLPLLAKDDVKEALFEALGTPPSRPDSSRLGRAAIQVLLSVARRAAVEGGASLIVECNFRRGQAEADLLPLAEVAELRLIHCRLAPELVLERYRRRAGRHAGHHDSQAYPDLVAGLERGEFEPLDLPVPILVVETAAGYEPAWEAILAFAR